MTSPVVSTPSSPSTLLACAAAELISDLPSACRLAARISWGMELARRFPGRAPNPRHFVRDALGDAAGSRLIWAAGVAESRDEGVGLVLSSAEFNRR